jgi:hypothetical protein
MVKFREPSTGGSLTVTVTAALAKFGCRIAYHTSGYVMSGVEKEMLAVYPDVVSGSLKAPLPSMPLGGSRLASGV